MFRIGLASILDGGSSESILVLGVVPLSLGYITCTFASGKLGKWENHNLRHHQLSLTLFEFQFMNIYVSVCLESIRLQNLKTNEASLRIRWTSWNDGPFSTKLLQKHWVPHDKWSQKNRAYDAEQFALKACLRGNILGIYEKYIWNWSISHWWR